MKPTEMISALEDEINAKRRIITLLRHPCCWHRWFTDVDSQASLLAAFKAGDETAIKAWVKGTSIDDLPFSMLRDQAKLLHVPNYSRLSKEELKCQLQKQNLSSESKPS